jgi:hypothetical protein
MKFAERLRDLTTTLKEHDRRCFVFSGERSLLVWLQRDGTSRSSGPVVRQAEVAALATGSSEIQALRVYVTSTDEFTEAEGLSVCSPSLLRGDYQELASEAQVLQARMQG